MDPHIKKWHLKWWYGWKGRSLVGLLLKVPQKYIIMPSLSLKSLLIEESFFVTVWSPPSFINRENETRCYLNATFQLLYFNVIFKTTGTKNRLLYHAEWSEKKVNILSIISKRSWLWRSYRKIWWDIFRRKQSIFYWYFLYFGKYKDKLSDGCKWIWGVII